MKNIFVCFKDLQTGPQSLIPILKEFGFRVFESVLDENQFYDLKKDKFNAQSSSPKPNATQSSSPKPDTTQSNKKKIDSTQTAGMMQSSANENEYTQKLYRIWKIVLKEGVDDVKVLKKLQELDFIEFAHFANKYALHARSNDPRYNDQWHLDRVRANFAWDITQGDGSIVVAVIDSGVDYNHSDINQNMWRNPVTGNYGFNIVAGDENPIDRNGHGTHVAGVIGSIINNNLDAAGIAKVKIMAIKAFGAEDEDDFMLRALQKAAENGAKIVNNSWGPESRLGTHTALETALRALAFDNIVCVFSAGDDNFNIDTVFPGTSESEIIIVAGSSKIDDRKTPKTNVGNKVTIVAPGEKIWSLNISSRSTRTRSMGGTSAAAPIVSGAIALLLSQTPNLTLSSIKTLLRNSSDNFGLTGVNTNTGRLNIYNLLLANNPALRSQARTISENPLSHPLNERNMNNEEKKYQLFQFILVNYLKTKLNNKLEDLGIGNIPNFIERIISDDSPEVELIQQIELTEKLLWIYRDVAEMYAIVDSPDNCPSGYYVCTIDGNTTCCPNSEVMLLPNESENKVVQPINISDLLKNNVFLYWNCDVSVYHSINPNMESKKVVVEDVFLRPKSGIKILDLNNIEDINVNNIKTIHFGAPYDIFINL